MSPCGAIALKLCHLVELWRSNYVPSLKLCHRLELYTHPCLSSEKGVSSVSAGNDFCVNPDFGRGRLNAVAEFKQWSLQDLIVELLAELHKAGVPYSSQACRAVLTNQSEECRPRSRAPALYGDGSWNSDADRKREVAAHLGADSCL
eukprot:5831894-Amphidinium_carterae.1